MKAGIAGILLVFATVVISEAEVIPVFIFAGQSIAINSGTDSGRLAAAMQASQTNVLFYNGRSTPYTPTSAVHWVTYQAPTGPAYPADSMYTNPQGTFGPEITTANQISRRFYGGGGRWQYSNTAWARPRFITTTTPLGPGNSTRRC